MSRVNVTDVPTKEQGPWIKVQSSHGNPEKRGTQR